MKKNNKISGQNLTARGEPFLWTMGGALAVGILMVVGFLCLVIVNGLTTFYPGPVYKLNLNNSKIIAGEPGRKETFKTDFAQADNSLAERTLYKTGNFDLYNEDYVWVADYEINKLSAPQDIFFIERMEWGPFIGFIKALQLDKNRVEFNFLEKDIRLLEKEHQKALQRRKKTFKIEKKDLGRINHLMEEKRLDLRRIEIKQGNQSKLYKSALQDYQKVFNEKYQVFANTPLKNWAMHGADALECAAVALKIHGDLSTASMTEQEARDLEAQYNSKGAM